MLEDTEDGYIELARGNYKEIKALEQQYREPDNGVYVYTEIVRNGKTRYSANDSIIENIGKHEQGSRQTGGKKLQTDTAGNNEDLRRSDKGKQSVKFSLPSTDSRGVELIPADVIAVFNPEVIKSVDNLDPTKEKDIEQGEMVEARNKPVAVPKSVKDAPQVECNQAERTNIQGFGIDDIPFAVQTDYIRLTAITYQA